MPRTLAPRSDDFAARLRRLRAERGWTQSQLAERAGCSKRSVLHYEQEGRMPPGHILAQLGAAFGLSVEAMLGQDEIPTKRARHEPDLLNDPVERRLWHRFRKMRQLSTRDQAHILRLLSALSTARSSRTQRQHQTSH